MAPSLFSLLVLLGCCLLLSDAQTTGSPGPTCSAGVVFNGEYSSRAGDYHVRWIIDCDQGELSAVITAQTTGWVGFGLNTNAGMVGGYVLQAAVVDGAVTYRTGHATEYSYPSASGIDIYTTVNGTESANGTVIGFVRKLSVPAPEISILSEGNYLIWAYQRSTDDFTREHSNKAAASVNFFTGKAEPAGAGTDYALIHGSLMMLAFGFLAPVGTFVARYLKGLGHPWYIMHLAIQYTMVALMLSAFIIIENDLGSVRSRHFDNPHSIIGLTIVILTIIQVIMGILANAMFKADRTKVPAFPDKVHWYLGRLVILYSIANVFVGFDEYGFTDHSNSPFIVFAVWIGVLTILFVVCDLLFGQKHHVEIEKSEMIQANKIPLVIYGSIFVIGIILFAVTLNEMWDHKIVDA